MTAWPSIQLPSVGSDEDDVIEQLEAPAESGYVQSRRKFTKAGREKFNLRWDRMPEADYQTLRTFRRTYIGTNFTWTHPVTAASYTVGFVGNSLASSHPVDNYRTVECTLEDRG